jgi:hypothetical protein
MVEAGSMAQDTAPRVIRIGVADITSERRIEARVPITVSGRLAWTDADGAARSADVRTENVSQHGVLLDCLSVTDIPLHRLVSVSLSAPDRGLDPLPRSLHNRHTPAAVYRIGPPRDPHRADRRYALRLLVEPN